MARAKRTEDPVDTVTLTLNLAEARLLMEITNRVGGSPHNSARHLTDRIGRALGDVGIDRYDRDYNVVFDRSDIFMADDSLLQFHPDELAEV